MAATLIKGAKTNIAAATNVAFVDGLPSPFHVAVQIVGTFTATVTFEVTVNGTDYTSIELLPTTDLSDTGLVASATAAGLFISKYPLSVSGIRARVSAFTSNTDGAISLRTSCF